MKQIFTLFIFMTFYTSFAQDVIQTSHGTSIMVKIDEIGIEKIKYHKFNNLKGPVYEILKTDIDQITFENGQIETFEIKDPGKSNTLQVKNTIIDLINHHSLESNSNKKGLSAAFLEDYLGITVLKKNGTESNEKYLYDFANVYKFGEVDYRNKDIAFINIWVALLKNAKKDKWEKDKLVIRLDSHRNADKLMRTLKEYNEILYLQAGG